MKFILIFEIYKEFVEAKNLRLSQVTQKLRTKVKAFQELLPIDLSILIYIKPSKQIP